MKNKTVLFEGKYKAVKDKIIYIRVIAIRLGI